MTAHQGPPLRSMWNIHGNSENQQCPERPNGPGYTSKDAHIKHGRRDLGTWGWTNGGLPP